MTAQRGKWYGDRETCTESPAQAIWKDLIAFSCYRLTRQRDFQNKGNPKKLYCIIVKKKTTKWTFLHQMPFQTEPNSGIWGRCGIEPRTFWDRQESDHRTTLAPKNVAREENGSKLGHSLFVKKKKRTENNQTFSKMFFAFSKCGLKYFQ